MQIAHDQLALLRGSMLALQRGKARVILGQGALAVRHPRLQRAVELLQRMQGAQEARCQQRAHGQQQGVGPVVQQVDAVASPFREEAPEQARVPGQQVIVDAHQHREGHHGGERGSRQRSPAARIGERDRDDQQAHPHHAAQPPARNGPLRRKAAEREPQRPHQPIGDQRPIQPRSACPSTSASGCGASAFGRPGAAHTGVVQREHRHHDDEAAGGALVEHAPPLPCTDGQGVDQEGHGPHGPQHRRQPEQAVERLVRAAPPDEGDEAGDQQRDQHRELGHRAHPEQAPVVQRLDLVLRPDADLREAQRIVPGGRGADRQLVVAGAQQRGGQQRRLRAVGARMDRRAALRHAADQTAVEPDLAAVVEVGHIDGPLRLARGVVRVVEADAVPGRRARQLRARIAGIVGQGHRLPAGAGRRRRALHRRRREHDGLAGGLQHRRGAVREACQDQEEQHQPCRPRAGAARPGHHRSPIWLAS
ncbi:LigA [Variovorax sp. WDL1]|nr:LigA [Variovorax sp. WDL1]